MIHSNEFLAAAGFAFEKRRGVSLGTYELSAIKEVGLADADCDRVADEIWASLKEERPDEYRINAYWALGKRYCHSDKQKLILALASELPRSLPAAYQIMIALENLSEEVFHPNRSGTSFDEAELNRTDAVAYLARAK